MGAVTAFITENYHCKPMMTDVIVIHNLANGKQSKIKKRWHFSQGLGSTKLMHKVGNIPCSPEKSATCN